MMPSQTPISQIPIGICTDMRRQQAIPMTVQQLIPHRALPMCSHLTPKTKPVGRSVAHCRRRDGLHVSRLCSRTSFALDPASPTPQCSRNRRTMDLKKQNKGVTICWADDLPVDITVQRRSTITKERYKNLQATATFVASRSTTARESPSRKKMKARRYSATSSMLQRQISLRITVIMNRPLDLSQSPLPARLTSWISTRICHATCLSSAQNHRSLTQKRVRITVTVPEEQSQASHRSHPQVPLNLSPKL
jgi:hypothetical protein